MQDHEPDHTLEASCTKNRLRKRCPSVCQHLFVMIFLRQLQIFLHPSPMWIKIYYILILNREASKQHEAVPRKWEFLLVPKCEVILFARLQSIQFTITYQLSFWLVWPPLHHWLFLWPYPCPLAIKVDSASLPSLHQHCCVPVSPSSRVRK